MRTRRSATELRAQGDSDAHASACASAREGSSAEMGVRELRLRADLDARTLRISPAPHTPAPRSDNVLDVSLSVKGVPVTEIEDPRPVVKAEEKDDTITVTWTAKDGFEPADDLKVTIAACYDAGVLKGRKWRKGKDDIKKNLKAQCTNKVVVGLDASEGEYTHMFDEDTPDGDYFIKIYVYDPSDEPDTYIGYGKSEGQFTVSAINPVTPGLVTGVIISAVLGPAIITGYMLWDMVLSPHAKAAAGK